MKTKLFVISTIMTILLSIIYLIYQNAHDKNTIKELSIQKAKFKFKERDALLSSFVQKYDKTIYAIKDNETFLGYVKKQNSKKAVNELFLSIIKSSPNIYQLRYIDKDGLEKIRVDQFRRNFFIIPDNELQNKKSRYYFTDIMSQDSNTIWHSKIDLNIEHGKIVRPIQPTLRVGTPVIVDGVKKGILIINVDVKEFFKKLKTASIFNIYLVDSQGEFILHPNDTYSWGKYLKCNLNMMGQFKAFSKDELLKEELITDKFYFRKTTFKNLDNITMVIEPKVSKLAEEITQNNINRLYYVLILMIIIFLAIYIIMKKRELDLSNNLNDQLKQQQDKVQNILDTQQSIVILTNGEEISECNKRFLKFFDIDNLNEFKKDHKCICEFFEDDKEHEYLQDHMDDMVWTDYVFAHKEKIHKVKMTDSYNNKHFFIVSAKVYSEKNNLQKYVITFSDVTELEFLNNNLEQIVEKKTKELQELNNSLENRINLEVEKNRQKDKQIFEKEKMASMGEMIGDIAHHWRQPLSVISTASSGIIMQNDLKILTDEYLEETMNVITKASQKLSKTIDNFRDLALGDMAKKEFNIANEINKALSISSSTSDDQYIQVIKELDSSIEIFNSSNALLQTLVNIFNNSFEILAEDEKLGKNKFIFVKCYKDEDEVVISIKDNAGGIEPNMLAKVFHAYTTTKHKSQNVGLSMHMSYSLISKNMEGHIDVDNEEFEYESKKYIGAIFTIRLALNKKAS